MPRGLFLDLDGTLANSLGVLRRVYRDFLAQHGKTPSDVEFEAMNGPPLATVVGLLRQRHSLPGTDTSLLDDYTQMLGDAHAAALPNRGARALLEAARASGWRTAVVTSATRFHAEAWLDRHQLRERIMTVVGGDEVARGKPAPDPYLLALSRIGCDPCASIAIEDSRSGAAAAVAAGLTTHVLANDDRAGWPGEVRFLRRLVDMIPVIEC
jgi:HAD superfamily hydrolase (TIGR01509 family)